MPPLGGYFIERRMSKAPARFAERFESRNDVSLRTSEAGSRTLSRFGVKDEQIYLVIREVASKTDDTKTRLKGAFLLYLVY